jgi:pimeloyl-ACP methyl ester carboxylesterase
MLKHVRFLATDGYKLAGLLYRPSQANAVAIYLHGNGYGSIFESVEKMDTFAGTLHKHNIAFFPFNNRGSNMVRKLKREVNGVEEETKGGTAYEILRDCIKDIDGAIEYLKEEGFDTFYLIGESTGANKICVYNYYKKDHPVSKVVLLSGGDDTGIHFQMMGRDTFFKNLEIAKKEIGEGNGSIIMKENESGLSYQSFYDTCNPDGDYNTFPYIEYFTHAALSDKQPLFQQYESLKMPVLVVYGANDEYTFGRVPEIVEELEKRSNSVHFKAVIIPDADHGLTGKLDEGATIIAEWLKNED